MKEKNSGISKIGSIIILFIILTFAVVTLIAFINNPGSIYSFSVRLGGLWGYLFMSVAAVMSPFLKEITKNFGKPFIKIHHIFAYTGIALIVLHPLLQAINQASLALFLPDFSSWFMFWALAGRPALIVLVIALIGVFLRKKIKWWRFIHVLMYIMLLMGFVHAILIGSDFASNTILVIFSILFGFVTLSFILKRIQKYRQFKNKGK